MVSSVPDPYAIPLEQLDPSRVEFFRHGRHLACFERLRREDPVHFVQSEQFGPYWSITKYNDIMDVETNHQVFSSDSKLGGITIRDAPAELRRPMFIAMDPPRHDVQRAAVAPAVVPRQLAEWEGLIRSRVQGVLDALPKVQAWRAALAARPSVHGAVIADYPERLRAFVMAQQGVLARRAG